MKKVSILTILALSICFATLHAQVLKKDVLLGGTFGFSTNNGTNSPNYSNANINPRIGYAIGNNSVISANFGYSFYRSKSDVVVNVTTSNSFNAGLSWKRFISIKEKVGFYTNLYGSMGKSYLKQESGIPATIQKSSSSNYTGGLTPGVYYMATPWLILSADAGDFIYTYNESKYSGSPVNHDAGFNVNFLNTFTFGVDFILHKRKK